MKASREGGLASHNKVSTNRSVLNVLTPVEAARTYAAAGFAVFPVYTTEPDGTCSCGNPECKHVGKHPLSRVVESGHLDATTDRATIEQWWALFPDANIGVALDHSGLVVVAPDSQDWLETFKRSGLPSTFHTQTGGGPGHEQYYYRRPADCPTRRICRSQEYDILSDGYVIAPPSRHRTGNHYVALSPFPSRVADLPDAPDWVTAMLKEADQRSRTTRVTFDEHQTGRGSEIYAALKPRVSAGIRSLIEFGPAGAEDRSTADAKVITALVNCGLDDDDIRSIYRTYPIGTQSKYAERGDEYLALTVENMRQHVQSSEPVQNTWSRVRSNDSPAVAPLEDAGILSIPSLVRVSDVQPRKVEWLWTNRIPLGKITVLDGDPGTGKSTVTLDIAARVSRFDVMPDGTYGDLWGPQNVLLVSYEDDTSDTIRPRLEAARAELDRVFVLSNMRDANGKARPVVIPDDLPMIERLVTQHTIKLVVIDPLTASLSGRVDSHRDQDVRRALTPLKELVERTGAAVLIVRHLNKGTGSNAVHRGGGSIGIIGAARAGLMAVKHPEDESKRILAVVKMNVGREAPSLVYRIEENADERSYVVWEGTTSLTANEALRALSGDAAPTEVERAREFLTIYLKDGPRSQSEILREAMSRGISERTLDRAKIGLAESVKRGFGDDGGWFWQLVARDHSTSNAL